MSFRTERSNLWNSLMARRHSWLLLAIIVTFSVRPVLGETPAVRLVFSLSLFLLLLVSLYTIQMDELVGDREALVRERRRRRIIAFLLAVPALVERVFGLLDPSTRMLALGAASWLLFLSFVVWSLLRTLLRHREVTGETIALSVSTYLLLGLTWGMLYILIYERHPDAFSLGATGAADPRLDPHEAFLVFIYFSLTTISTIGFGDITPVSLPARYAAVAEGITGQFYLAILVARLVGMHMSRAQTENDKPPG